MIMKILVTGVNGFVGKHLVRELKARGIGVVGLGHETPAHPEIAELLDKYEVCDLTDQTQVEALDLSGINAVINLAGLANVGASFDAEALYKKVNVEVLTKLGKHLQSTNPKARLVAISTGAVYDPEQPLPLSESSKTVTSGSPYAASKLMMEDTARQLRKEGVDCVITRPFNHIGPGQLPGFLVPDLCHKIMEAKKTGGTVTVGNLATKRDYTDVRDIVKAYADLAVSETLESDIYNVCSGTARSGKEILELILDATASKDDIAINVDRSLIRPNDPADLHGSYARLNEETGWEPVIPFEQTIRDIVASY